MNDFVMSVVNEVLSKSGTSSNTAIVSNINQELIRPNYQRQNEKKRLLVYDLPQFNQKAVLKSGPQSIHSGSIYPTSKNIPEMNHSKSDSIQELRIQNMKTVIAHESYANNDYANNTYVNNTDANNMNTNDKNLKETTLNVNPISDRRTDSFKDFAVCSLEDNKQLKRLFGFPYSSKDTACIGMQERCILSQLFAVNEILNRIPALDFFVQWSLNNSENFVFQAIGTKEQMEVAADILNSKCRNTKGILMVKQPSSYLKKRLNNSADTIGTIEGVPYARLLPSVAEHCKKYIDSMLEYQIFGSYLLVSGQTEEVEQLLKYLL